MNEAPAAPARHRSPRFGDGEVFAALDLGTNNCRLLVATPAGRGFRIVDSYSRIVRLRDALTQNGRLSDRAMARAMNAPTLRAAKIRRPAPPHARPLPTQPCPTP